MARYLVRVVTIAVCALPALGAMPALARTPVSDCAAHRGTLVGDYTVDVLLTTEERLRKRGLGWQDCAQAVGEVPF